MRLSRRTFSIIRRSIFFLSSRSIFSSSFIPAPSPARAPNSCFCFSTASFHTKYLSMSDSYSSFFAPINGTCSSMHLKRKNRLVGVLGTDTVYGTLSTILGISRPPSYDTYFH